jgi:hypothetical protein
MTKLKAQVWLAIDGLWVASCVLAVLSSACGGVSGGGPANGAGEAGATTGGAASTAHAGTSGFGTAAGESASGGVTGVGGFSGASGSVSGDSGAGATTAGGGGGALTTGSSGGSCAGGAYGTFPPAAWPQTEQECRACSGEWSIHGVATFESCVCRTCDGGKRCRDGNDCQGQCIADDEPEQEITDAGPPARGFFVGRCSELEPVYGCYRFIDRGATANGPGLLSDPPQPVCAD